MITHLKHKIESTSTICGLPSKEVNWLDKDLFSTEKIDIDWCCICKDELKRFEMDSVAAK